MQTRSTFAFQTPTRSLVKDVFNASLGGLPGVATPQNMINKGLDVTEELDRLAQHLGIELVTLCLCVRDPLAGDPAGNRVYTEDERRQLATACDGHPDRVRPRSPCRRLP